MHRYMWDMVGDYADNNTQALIEHKDELLAICDKILRGCTYEWFRLDTYNMRAKILHAEGKTEEALALYREKFINWYQTRDQKSEQLFSKETPEFLYWVRKNMYELVAFAADKLSKSIFFDSDIPYEEKVRRIESYGDRIMEIYNETQEDFFLMFSSAIMGRLTNDLKYRGGIQADVDRTKAKTAEIRAIVTERAKSNQILKEVNIRP